MIKNNKNLKKFFKGFAMLYASLVGSLVLAIGLAILNVTVKQITLAAAGRESQHAFYAADTGLECAMFLKSDAGGGNPACRGKVFGGADGVSFCDDDGDGGTYTYKCARGNVVPGTLSPDGDSITFPFSVSGGNLKTCFEVSVTKNPLGTYISSRGFNTCDTGAQIRFEREIISCNYANCSE